MNPSTAKRMEKSALPVLSVTEDTRSIVMPLRLILSLAALLLVGSSALESLDQQWLLLAPLLLHATYSAGLYLFMLHSKVVLPFRTIAFFDVAWAMVLVSLSNGSESVFFSFILFAVLSSAFCGGVRMGIQTTLAAAALFVVVNAATSFFAPAVEPGRAVLRMVIILLFGYMASYCGGAALLYKRRLILLREVTKISNPRFGVEHAISSVMQRLGALYGSQMCLFITCDEGATPCKLRRLDAEGNYNVDAADPAPELVHRLMQLPPAQAVVYSRRSITRILLPNFFACDVSTGRRADHDVQTTETVAELLDAQSFISIPLRRQKKVIGRIFLSFDRRYAVEPADIDFILHVCEYVIPMLDHIQLVERLANSAAEDERKRIALDIHDSLIQPYIGLQIGLEAVRQRLTRDDIYRPQMESEVVGHEPLRHPSTAGLHSTRGVNGDQSKEKKVLVATSVARRSVAATGNRAVADDITRLCQLAEAGVADLRKYVRGLRGDGACSDNLVPAIRRYALKVQDATGIAIEVQAEDAIHVGGRLAAEVFQMVCEGLSNVRRHTNSPKAIVALSATQDTLSVAIRNECDPAGYAITPPFTPRSISQRAGVLGGTVEVQREMGNGNSVIITIPL